VAFVLPVRWEPWNDNQLPEVQFLEYFRFSRANFAWLCGKLRGALEQDPLRRGAPLSVETLVAVGLYCLVHGAKYITISHVFNIGKETAEKACSCFVKHLLYHVWLYSLILSIRAVSNLIAAALRYGKAFSSFSTFFC
jgi:hypothetical protein